MESLKHGSYTIECDVKDALQEAKTVFEFLSASIDKLESIKAECDSVIEELREDFLTLK